MTYTFATLYPAAVAVTFFLGFAGGFGTLVALEPESASLRPFAAIGILPIILLGFWLGRRKNIFTIAVDGLHVEIRPWFRFIPARTATRAIALRDIASYAFIHGYKGGRVIKIGETAGTTSTVREDSMSVDKSPFDNFAQALSEKFQSLSAATGWPVARPSFWLTPQARLIAILSVAASLAATAGLALYTESPRAFGMGVVSLLMIYGFWTLTHRHPWK